MTPEQLKEITFDAKMVELAKQEGIRCPNLEKHLQEKLNQGWTLEQVKPVSILITNAKV